MEDALKKLKGTFTDSIFHEIELTAKYCKKLGAQVLEQYDTDLQVEEFVVLDTLINNEGICQRDIARLILKDRANTGKIINNLEKKGLVERVITVKNNRPVKIPKLTLEGIKKTKEVMTLVKPHLDKVNDKIKDLELTQIRFLLASLRHVLGETLEIKI